MPTMSIMQETETHENLFAEKILGMLNGGAAAMMISIGHRTGLFDTMATLKPETSEGIARAAGLNERYVREWLGAMVTSGIVMYEPKTKTYRLPETHARMLTRANEANNMATIAQYIPMLGTVEDKVAECFRNGGGVPYSGFPRFQTVMADDSGQSVRSSLLDHILPLMPGMRHRLEKGISVLDVGCGMGKAMLLMAEYFPKSRFSGYDISCEGIASAKAEAAERGLTNIRFMRRDAATFPDTEVYDLIVTCDAIHDQAKPMDVLKNIHRALKKDGIYMMQDIDASSEVYNNIGHPIGTFLYTISCMHCMTVSLADGGAGLGAVWGVELARQMLWEAGFRDTEIKRLPHDIQNCYYISKK